MEKDWTVIPDIHGRNFWHEAVKGHEDERIVFLGDYLDPYSREGITPAKATEELEAVINFKKEHPDNVVLLLGNHDLGYLDSDICECRHDYYRAAQNRRLFEDNLDMFDLVHVTSCEGHNVLFSHAGIGKKWVKKNFAQEPFDPLLLNNMLHDPKRRGALMSTLSDVSVYRGGWEDQGSCVWADMREYMGAEGLLPGYFHIFGHTYHDGGPFRVESDDAIGLCVDCAEAFRLGQLIST